VRSRHGISDALTRYGAELVIVFVGVYAAFWVDNYRDNRQNEERTRQIVLTLQQDLHDYVTTTNKFNAEIEKRLGEWNASRARGEKPAPYVFRIEGSETPPIAVWEAVSQSSLVELLEPNLLFDLGFFYSEMEGVGKKYVRYAEFTDARVMPGLKVGEPWFYEQNSGLLRPEFAAHMDRLRDFLQDQARLRDWAQCLARRLDRYQERTDTCRRSLTDPDAERNAGDAR